MNELWIGINQEINDYVAKIATNEIKRFVEKFKIDPKNIEVRIIENPPFVQIHSVIELKIHIAYDDVNVKQYNKYLTIQNYIPKNAERCGIERFSYLDVLIAEKVKSLFKGEIQGLKYFSRISLVVISENDMIEISYQPLL